MRTLILEEQENCGEKTCDDCRWVYGEEVGDPYCGWFECHAVKRPENTVLGKYKDSREKLVRLPECIAAEKS
jgi:hypothetical protein